jgi:hypothetical protein
VDEQEDFLSPKHSQLLNIAIWAKYLAWIALIAYIIRAVLAPFFSQAFYEQTPGVFFGSSNFWAIVLKNPLYYLVNIGADAMIVLLKGSIFYMVLKGISLGLYMIVETDINYRDNENQGGAS